MTFEKTIMNKGEKEENLFISQYKC